MANTVAEDLAKRPKEAPNPGTRSDLANLSLDRLASEVMSDTEKMRAHLDQVKPLDYTQADSFEKQKDSIALTQSYLMIVLAFATRELPVDAFTKLDVAWLEKIIGEKGDRIFPDEPTKKAWEKAFESSKTLFANKGTPVWQAVFARWDELKKLAEEWIRATLVKSPAPQWAPTPAWASTLPAGPVGWSSADGGVLDTATGFLWDNKWKIAIAGAIALAAYFGFRNSGGEGSKDESKWFSGITDWKVLTAAALATAFGLYKFGPDWIKDAFEKFKSFILSEKTSTIESTKITDLSKKIVEYNNKKNSSDRRNSFPEKLIKSKGWMTLAEFKDKDWIFSNAMYMFNSGISWLTGTSGGLSNDMKQEWNDYQLLLDYTKQKTADYKIDYKNDDTMDDVWKKIIEKEEGK